MFKTYYDPDKTQLWNDLIFNMFGVFSLKVWKLNNDFLFLFPHPFVPVHYLLIHRYMLLLIPTALWVDTYYFACKWQLFTSWINYLLKQ